MRSPPDPALLSEWQSTASGEAGLKLSLVSSGGAPALQMDFSFTAGGGFVVARRELRRSMPDEYAVCCRLRGRGAVITLEIKLIDDTGRNVWRHVIKDLVLPARWTSLRIESREIDFAWGPAGSGSISRLGSIEVAIVRAAAAAGTLWIANLQIEDTVPAGTPVITASSEMRGFEAARALAAPGWKPAAADRKPWIAVDSQATRRIGGLMIDWQSEAPPSGFRIRGSNNGLRWKNLYIAKRAGGERSYVYLPDTQVRYVRLELSEPSHGATLHLRNFEFSRSIDAFWHDIAAAEARGWHPRWLHREQSLWTPIGTSHGEQCALMNHDGMVEVAQGSFCIEPMLWIEDRLVTWSDVFIRQELRDAWMPVPSVIWETAEWHLRIQAEAADDGGLQVRYRLENRTARMLSARLFVLVRPFQVTPPWQHFRNFGGVSRLHDLVLREGAVCVNESARIVPWRDSTRFGALCFDDGFMPSYLARGSLPAQSASHDPFGFATGALEFDMSPAGNEIRECGLTCLAHKSTTRITGPAFDWASQVAVSQWSGAGWAADAILASLTATAHVLVTRAGPALQPGPRRYTRSWIRDGAMMSAALLRMGHAKEVREYIEWYAPHQRADGFVPCCVDSEGADWLVEHDSHGQLIALLADYHRFTSDRKFLEDAWTHVVKAVGCIANLLDASGLLPISVSHEGYLAQPVHSYWDDFWALRGLRDAAHLAVVLGHAALADEWHALSIRFAASLFASIENTRSERRLDFIPGSIEWADFDPTATANALYLLDVPAELDQRAVERTFAIYLAEWRGKRNGTVEWTNYTPYEIRIIGAFVRLGKRSEALELLRFFLSDRRPLAWNQWPEIAWRDEKAPAHLGDLPHTWIAAEYVLAVRCLFAYERETDASLVVGAGLAAEWIEGVGVHVKDMPTSMGNLNYSMRRLDSRTVRCELRGDIAGKVVLRPPLGAALRGVVINGEPCSFDGDSVTIPHLPAEVICTT